MSSDPNPTPAAEVSPSPSADPQPDLRALPRWSLMVVAGLHGLIFAWAGAKLPWSEGSGFTILCYLLAAGHALTAACAALRVPALVLVWRGASVLSLAVLGWLSWELTSSASYLAGLYGSLGEGIGAGLLALVGLVALLTLPLSCWGLAATWKRSFNAGLSAAMTVLVVIWSLGALHQADAAKAEWLPLPGEVPSTERHAYRSTTGILEPLLYEAIDAKVGNWGLLSAIPTDGPLRKTKDGTRPSQLSVPSLFTAAPIACVPDPSSEESVAVLTYLRLLDGPSPHPKQAPVEVVSRCLRAPPGELFDAIATQILAEAASAPVKIDLITGVQALSSRHPVLDTFALRPGLDGVCDEEHCLMPWQLVALDQFIRNEPLPFVPDFRYGVSAVELRRALGFEVPEQVLKWDREQRRSGHLAKLVEEGEATPEPDDAEPWVRLDGLSRIETLSYVYTSDGEQVSLLRGHESMFDDELERDDWVHALELAERNIAKAQVKGGRFRYTLHPYTGRQNKKAWNLPRQAGTTLVMCELGQKSRRTKRVAERSLAYMAKHARDQGEFSVLIRRVNSTDAGLGPTALPTIAFARCRERVGEVHDELLAELGKFLLLMQREDGSFYPKYDTANAQIVDGPEPMYAGGQAVYALSLIEKITLDDPEAAAAAGMPSSEELHAAVERAMAYYTGPYWDTFVRDFFWLEENWHCLAARASLEHHRNEAYEQYCVDYMRYKARLVFGEDSRVAREFWGSYSFGNILTPVNTPAAGFGEGLAAAISILEARGEDTSAEREQMQRVIEFLVRQQWNEDNCFACVTNRTVLGGFSESMSAPEIRIDYTQHAWAALGHGGAWVHDPITP